MPRSFQRATAVYPKYWLVLWRDDALGPMQVVSGPISRQKIHFEAPPAPFLPPEMMQFLLCFNVDQQDDPIIKAGLAQHINRLKQINISAQ